MRPRIDVRGNLLSETFDAALKTAGTDKLKRGGCEVHYVEGRISVSWKDEYLRLAGPEKAAAVQAEAAKQPPPKKIQVVRLEVQTPAPAA